MEGYDVECSMCCDVFVDPVVTPCNHKFCKICLRKWLLKQGCRCNTMNCPLCRHGLEDFNYQTWNVDTKNTLIDLFKTIDPSNTSFIELVDSVSRLFFTTYRMLEYERLDKLIDDEMFEKQHYSLFAQLFKFTAIYILVYKKEENLKTIKTQEYLSTSRGRNLNRKSEDRTSSKHHRRYSRHKNPPSPRHHKRILR